MLLSPWGGSTAASDAAMACGSIPMPLFGMQIAVDHDRQACGPTPCWKSWTVGAAVYDRLGQAWAALTPEPQPQGCWQTTVAQLGAACPYCHMALCTIAAVSTKHASPHSCHKLECQITIHPPHWLPVLIGELHQGVRGDR